MGRSTLFCLLILLSISFCYCTNPNKKVDKSTNDSISIDEMQKSHINAPLQPLESGELNVTDEVFGTTINLIGQPINTKEITRAVQMLVKGKFLITNNQRSDSLFMIFKLPEMKCITAFGRSGRGPDEFGFPKIVKAEEDSILFYIYNHDKVYKVPIENMIPKYHLTLPKQDRFDDKQIVFFDSKIAYYAASTTKGKEIYYFNIDSVPNEKSIIDLSIPRLKGSWTTYIGDFGTNKYYGRIAYAYKYFKRLRIIDIKTMNQRDIIFDAKELAKGQSDIANLDPSNITHFWGMSPGEKYFWMLYSGRTPIEVQRANRSNSKFIYVEKYDWNGNPIKRYKLDDWGYFCVDEENETLYLSSTASVYSILKYDLSDTIKVISSSVIY